MNDVPYLERLSGQAAARHDISDIRRTIERDGFWERHQRADHQFVCHCPTLERAIEMLSVYDQLIMDLFWTLGWPSWATKAQLEP